jgi:mono/diheme cytochrome c family protein
MNRASRNLWTQCALRSTLSGVLVVGGLLGCGNEQRSGSVPADTARSTATDTVSARTGDTTGAQLRDSSSAARPETTVVRSDTTKAVATRPVPKKPVTPKPTTPKPPTPKPSAPATPQPDTSRPDSAAAAQPPESGASGTPTADASAPLRDQYHQAPKDTVAQQVYDGWKQFNLNCARCHGEDVQGTTIAPHLIVSLRPDGPINTKELFIQTVCAGRPAKGMPSWCALGMEMPTIEAIYSYVKGRSDAKIHPGRPAVRSGG